MFIAQAERSEGCLRYFHIIKYRANGKYVHQIADISREPKEKIFTLLPLRNGHR
jgi:hypothetical protein